MPMQLWPHFKSLKYILTISIWLVLSSISFAESVEGVKAFDTLSRVEKNKVVHQLFADLAAKVVQKGRVRVRIPLISPLDSGGSRHPVPVQVARVFRVIPPPLVGA